MELNTTYGVVSMIYFYSKLKIGGDDDFLLVISARERIRTATVARHPLKVVRLPISPPGRSNLDCKYTAKCIF